MQVFISYTKENTEEVNHLKADMEGIGHQVWIDTELAGGESWWHRILNEIRACDLFIFALSPASVDSNACNSECRYAMQLHKRVLPILVKGEVSTSLLPMELSSLQFLDYRQFGKESLFSLIKAINNLPDFKPLPDPLPEPPEVPISYLGELKNQIHSNKALSFEAQSGLVLKLKERIKNGKEREDVLYLINKLRQRDDLFFKVAEEIDGLLQNRTQESTETKQSDTKEKDAQATDNKTKAVQATDTKAATATGVGSTSSTKTSAEVRPKPKKDWSAEITERKWDKQYLKIEALVDGTPHLIEFIGGIVLEELKLDGKIVATYALAMTTVKMPFHIKNKGKNLNAKFTLKCGYTGAYKGCQLIVDNYVLLTDGKI